MDNIEEMEGLLSNVLRTGVLLSGCLILLGLIMTVATGDTTCPNGDMSLAWLVWGSPFLEPSHILFIGFLTLIATPVLRIVASIMIYVKARDTSFATITTIVLLILVVSFTLGVG
jgi:uncharacterized membrane protein